MWAPQGNRIAYVKENDIFYRLAPETLPDIQLTFTGRRNQIYNGVPDWVYEGIANDTFTNTLHAFEHVYL